MAAVGLRTELTGAAPLTPDACLLLGLMVLWASMKSPACSAASGHAQGGNAGQFRLIAGSHLRIARAMWELAGGFTQTARARAVSKHVQMARGGQLGMHTHIDMRPGQWLLVRSWRASGGAAARGAITPVVF
jgi:hypothetical protein